MISPEELRELDPDDITPAVGTTLESLVDASLRVIMEELRDYPGLIAATEASINTLNDEYEMTPENALLVVKGQALGYVALIRAVDNRQTMDRFSEQLTQLQEPKSP